MTSQSFWSPVAELSSSLSGVSLSPISPDDPIADLTDHLEKLDDHPFAFGGYADVYRFRARASLDGQNTRGNVFAVKTANAKLRTGNGHKGLRKMQREIGVWTSLDHKNVLKLHGVLIMGNNLIPSLVSDFMENGTVMQYLEETPASSLIHLMYDIANGLSYLHDEGIAHGDIKADNILVGRDGCARIGDFGLSRMLGDDGFARELSTTDGQRCSRWTATEYLQFAQEDESLQDQTKPDNVQIRPSAKPPQGPTKPGDVWSFGCTILQMFSGELPFYDASSAEVVIRLAKGKLPKFPPCVFRPDFEKYRNVISTICLFCWVKDPIHRPTMRSLESVICSFLCEATCSDPNINGTTQRSSSPQEYVQTSSQIDGSDVDASDGTRSRSSSQSTITPDSSLDEPSDLQIPFASEPEDELGPEPGPLFEAELQEELRSAPSPPVVPAELATPPLAPPSVENMLRHNNLSAQSILNELIQLMKGFNIKYEDGQSTGPSHLRTHVVACIVNGEQYGVGAVVGKKKVAKEKAAVAALERLYLQDPVLHPSLCYLPILTAHLNEHHLSARAMWSSHFGPSTNDPASWQHRVTFTFDGIAVADGLGSTFSIAKEDAARKVGMVWNQTIAKGA